MAVVFQVESRNFDLGFNPAIIEAAHVDLYFTTTDVLHDTPRLSWLQILPESPMEPVRNKHALCAMNVGEIVETHLLILGFPPTPNNARLSRSRLVSGRGWLLITGGAIDGAVLL